MSKPKYYELVDSIVGMACQYLEDSNGELDDHAASAGENTIQILEELGLVKDNKILSEAFNLDYLKSTFGEN